MRINNLQLSMIRILLTTGLLCLSLIHFSEGKGTWFVPFLALGYIVYMLWGVYKEILTKGRSY